MSDNALIRRWARAMRDADWQFTVDEPKHLIVFLSTNNKASFRLMIVFKEKEEHVIMLLCLERRCPAEYRKTMMDYCNRLNYKIPIGFFACDPDDGEIRFRHSVDAEKIELTGTFVDNFIKVAIGSMRREYDNLQAIMSGLSINAAKAAEDL